MKLLLTGKSGQVGSELQRALLPLGEIISIGTSDCDLTNEYAIRQVIRNVRPNVIINPAAFTSVDKAEIEKSLASAINSHAPEIIAEEANSLGALLVHYSTDYVFDGTKIGAYCELDKPNPINVYGVSKLAGEQAIQTTHDRHLILRTSWVVGAHGSNFAKTVLRKASRGEALTVVADQFGAPTSASLIADITAHLVRQALRTPTTFPFGLYHVAASGETSWYTYACHVVERAISAGQILRMTPEDIKAIKTSEYSALANRPKNSKLDTNMLCNTFDLHLPHWKTSVDHVLDEIFTTYD